MYLLVGGGHSIQTTIAPEDGLERAFLELHFSFVDDEDADLHEDVLSGLKDDENWEMAGSSLEGAAPIRMRYYCSYDDGYVEVIRLPDDWLCIRCATVSAQ